MNYNLLKLSAYNSIDAKNMTVEQLREHFDDQCSMALVEALRKAK